MQISEEEYMTLATKAAKWDALDEKLSDAYYYDHEEDPDLADIGEMAATAFGYL